MLSRNGALASAALILIGQAASAALVISDATPYTQDFNFLSTSSGVVWVDDQATESTTGSPGWLWQSDGGDLPYDASAGGNATGSPYSYGAVGDPDRAMGNLGGGDNDNTAWGLVIQNNAATAITSLDLSFTAEQWRTPTGNPASTDEEVRFSYQVFTVEPTDLEIAAGPVPAGWIEEATLSFDVISTTGSGAVDGNSDDFREELSASLAAEVAPGSFLALRWYDGDQSGFDYGMAIDDLTVAFTLAPIPEPGAALFGSLIVGGMGLCVGRRRRA